jgi:hypothetical protein
MQHLRSHAIDDPERHLCSILRRINVRAERPLAERRIDDLHDGFGNRAHIGVLGHDSGEGLLNSLAITFIRPCFVFGEAGLVGRHAGMREMVRALRKRAEL